MAGVRNFQQLFEFLREPEAPILSPQRFSEVVGIDLEALAKQAHVHPNALTSKPGTEALQHFLRDALRVLKAATDLCGDLNKALSWYRSQPLRPFNNMTPGQVISEGKTDALINYIAMLEAGSAG
jgi:hypothetical protein